MTERKKPASKAAEAQKKVAAMERQEKARSPLDDPGDAERPSSTRHWIYLAAWLGGGLLLNLALIAILGGSGV
jgi:hypothetical protein